jgi:hypothetical protein
LGMPFDYTPMKYFYTVTRKIENNSKSDPRRTSNFTLI